MADRWDSSLYDDRHSFVWKQSADLIDILAPQPGERVLDLGCGTGHLTAQIAARGAEVVGIDSSLSMIAQARQNYPRLKFQSTPCSRMPRCIGCAKRNARRRACLGRSNRAGGWYSKWVSGATSPASCRELRLSCARLACRRKTPGTFRAWESTPGCSNITGSRSSMPKRLPGGTSWSIPQPQREALITAIEARLKPVLFRDGAWWADYRRLRIAGQLG